MQYETLVFDLDGTLSDPAVGIVRCMNHALAQHGLRPRSEAEIRARIGPPLEETMQAFSGSDDERLIRAMLVTYRQRYGELGYAENSLYPDVVDTLTRLQEAGVRMGICTSKKREYALKVLDHFRLSGYFEFVSGPEYGMAKGQQLAELLRDGTLSQSALMIGDRAVDLIAARENDLDSAGVLWGFGSEQELRTQEPRFLFRNPGQWLALFQGLFK